MKTIADGNRGGNDRCCPWCRGWFTPGRSDQKFCTRSCKSSAAAVRSNIRLGRIADRPVTAQHIRNRPSARKPGLDDYHRET